MPQYHDADLQKLNSRISELENNIQKINKKFEYDFFNLTQEVKYVKLNSNAKEPFKKHDGDAGYDLYACFTEKDSYELKPLEQIKIPTGIAISLNEYTVGLINDRSSMASKQLVISGGVIDEPYTGEISILLMNLSNTPYEIKNGDKIAQILIQAIVKVNFIEVKELKTTERGNKGFGSTGK